MAAPNTVIQPAVPSAYIAEIIWVRVDISPTRFDGVTILGAPPILYATTSEDYQKVLNDNLSQGYVFVDSKVLQSMIGADGNWWAAVKLVMAKY